VWARVLCVAPALAGCNLVFQSRLGDPDAAIDAPAIGACPWGNVEPIGDPGDTDPAVSDDELVLVFARRTPLPPPQTGSHYDLFVATRSSELEPFAVAPPPLVNDAGHDDTDPALSSDGKHLVFLATGRSAQTNVFRSIDSGNGFAATSPQLDLNLNDGDASALALSGDALRIYYNRGNRLVTRSRTSPATGVFNDETDLGPSRQFFAISPSQLELYTHENGKLMRALRAKPTEPFGEPKPIGIDGENPYLAGGGLALYFTLPGDGGIVVTRRTCIDDQL
jgi:hypothetical protein